MPDIIHRIGIKAAPAKVYDAIATVAGVAGWWTEETTGDSKAGGVIRVRFSQHDIEKGRMELEVVKLKPAQEVQWRVKAGPPEWVGTDVTFSLSQDGEYTVILFGHRNWREPVEFMAQVHDTVRFFTLSRLIWSSAL